MSWFVEEAIKTFCGNVHRKHILKLIVSSEIRSQKSPKIIKKNVITLDIRKITSTSKSESCMRIIRK